MTVPMLRYLTSNVIATLEDRTGRPCGDHQLPESQATPFQILRHIDGDRYWGPPLTAPESDVEAFYQVDAVADTREQAEWMADRSMNALLGRNGDGSFKFAITAPTGWQVSDRRWESSGGVDRSGDGPKTTWTAPRRYVLAITPGG